MKKSYRIVLSVVTYADNDVDAANQARTYQRRLESASTTIEAIFDADGDEIDSDPYEGSFRESADNEGSRIAADSRGEGEN